MVWEDATPKNLLTPSSFDNAVTCVLACGGSTNAAIHLIAMARRAGVPLDLERFDAISRKTPVIANLRPSDRKSTRLNSSHSQISYAVFCLKKKTKIMGSIAEITYPTHRPRLAKSLHNLLT